MAEEPILFKKPVKCTNEHLTFLDDLRASGVTNMFGARPFLEGEFHELNSKEAGDILVYWMKTFADRGMPGKTKK